MSSAKPKRNLCLGNHILLCGILAASHIRAKTFIISVLRQLLMKAFGGLHSVPSLLAFRYIKYLNGKVIVNIGAGGFRVPRPYGETARHSDSLYFASQNGTWYKK